MATWAEWESEILRPLSAGTHAAGGEIGALGKEITSIRKAIGDVVKELGRLGKAVGDVSKDVGGAAKAAKKVVDSLDPATKVLTGGGKGGGGKGGGAGGGGGTGGGSDNSLRAYLAGLRGGKKLLKEHLLLQTESRDVMKQYVPALKHAAYWSARHSDSDKKRLGSLEDQIVAQMEIVESQKKGTAEHKAAQEKLNKLTEKYGAAIQKANKHAASHTSILSQWSDRIDKAVTATTEILTGRSLSEQFDIKNMAREAVEFDQAMSQIAFQQGQIATEGKNLVWQDNIRTKSGFEQKKFAEALYKVRRKGMKDQKVAQKTTEEALKLAKVIGSEHVGTAEAVRKMTMEFELGNSETMQMTHHISEAARQTGIVGDELLSVVESSKKYMDNMKSAGVFTADAAGAMVRMTAEAQKLGVGGQAGQLQGLLTGGFHNLAQQSGSNPMANMLMRGAGRAGVYGELRAGRGGDPEVMKKIMMGMREDFEAMAGGKSIDQMSDSELAALQVRVGAHYGMGPGDVDRIFKAMEEATMSFSDRLKKATGAQTKYMNSIELLNHQVGINNMKFGEASSLMDQVKKKGMTGDVQDRVAALLDAAGNTAGASAARAGSMDAGGAKQAMAEAMYKATLETQKKVSAGGGDITKMLDSKVLQKIRSGDKDKVKEGLIEIQAASSQAGVALSDLQDPATRTASWTEKIHSFLMNKFGGILGWASTILGLLAPIASIIQAAVILKKMYHSMTKKRSIYTHDIRVVEAINKLDMGGGGGSGGDGRRRRRRGRRGRGRVRRRGFGRSKGVLGKVKGLFGKVGGLAGKAAPLMGMMDMPGADLLSMGDDVGGAARGGGRIAKGATKGARGAGKAVGMMGKAGKGLLRLGKGFGKLIPGLGIAIAAFDGITGGLEAAANSAEIFGVKQEEVTTGMKVAAGAAGGITGVMNGLTFGIFEGALGPNGTWTKGIANFFHGAGSIISSGWEGFKGIIGSAMSGIGGLLQGAWDGIKSVGKAYVDAHISVLKGAANIAVKVGSGIVSGAKAVGSGIVGGAKAVGSAVWSGLKSLWPFQKGGVVEETGAAKVHKGEIIAPPETLATAASTPVTDAIQMVLGGKKGAGGGFLGNVLQTVAQPLAGVLSPINAMTGGMFDWLLGGSGGMTAKGPRTGKRHAESNAAEQRAGTGLKEKGSLKDQSSTAHNTAKTAEQVEAIRAAFDKLIAFMTQSAPNPIDEHPEAGDPRANKKPRAGANYYAWQMSRYTSNVNKGPISDPTFG